MKTSWSVNIPISLILGGHSLVAVADIIPGPESFIRHPFVAVAVVGDYVYLDGGELAQFVDGVVDKNKPGYPLNTTLSLPISSSWTNASVTLRSIPKTAPSQDLPITWYDPSASAFYEWGGCTSWFGPAVDNLIWKFTADGSGGGAWSQVTPSSIVAFNNANRPFYSAFAMHRGIGYALSGIIGHESEASAGARAAVPGLVSFDTGSLRWDNASSTGYEKYGTSIGGRMESVPLGPNGLLMVLGGAEAPVGVINTTQPVSWDTLGFVDPVTGKWYSQATTGQLPTQKQDFCSVGVQGPNGTYEIFIYGGTTGDGKTLDEIHVLSLPGFVFFKSPTPGTPRNDHACVTIGPSDKTTGNNHTNRQMLSVGGSNGALGFPQSQLDPDPWKQGLGVFDLTDMVWKSRYDVDAGPYDTPEPIRNWYAQGGLDTVSWTNDDVKALFKNDANATEAADPGNSTLSSSSSVSSVSSPPNSPSAAPSSTTTSKSNAGAIAGGTIGGVVGVALIAALAFFSSVAIVERVQQHELPRRSNSNSNNNNNNNNSSNPMGGPSRSCPLQVCRSNQVRRIQRSCIAAMLVRSFIAAMFARNLGLEIHMSFADDIPLWRPLVAIKGEDGDV
ncbi:Kelch repeat-containing protein [Apiospora saccharicola]|uniref:Kelch repeat-containing protein n=1 Tax=Apiospora saccharicola TaxID=335842 RepID=A0ABR1TLY7_9PEZI